MKRNLKNSCFVVLGFLLVWNLLSCNNIFIFKKTTQVSFNLNIQGLQVAHQKQSGALNNRAAGGDVSQVIISLYQATDPASISENQQLDTSKLKHLESITPAVAPDGKVLATFNEVTVGIDAVIFVEIYETDPADASQNLAYKGNSSVFTVQEGENNVEIELKKVAAPNQVDSVQFNPATGPVDTGTTVTLFCDTTDAIIYYTTDGSAPTTSSNRYTSTPITITAETTIKAYAVKSGMTPSDVTERTYSLNQYTITFVLNGGSFTENNKENPISVPSGTEVVLKNYQVERSGYEFGGWYYDAAFKTPVDNSNIVTPTQANITLYAKWEAQEQVASVKFDPATGPVDTGTTVTLSCDTADATIYYTTDGRAPTTSSNRYTSTPITITAETTIKAYAVKSGMTPSDVTERTYSLNQYTVQFVLNGGSFTDGKTDSVSVTSGNSVNLTTYQPQYAGHTFGGWYYDASLQKAADSSVTPNTDNTTSGTLTLYAKWEAVNNSITSFADLKSAITSASETIHVAGNFEISETLTIGSTTTLIADAPTTFTRKDGFTGALFTNSADFTLQGSENAIITINGNDIEASAPAIQSTANLTVTYCNFENNTNTYSDGGAIFVDTTATVTFSASNCNFTDNQVTRFNMAGGAVAINAANSTSSFDTCKFSSNIAKQQGGGAIYINGDTSAYSGKWHEITNCEFTGNRCNASSNYGGAIYFTRGSLSLSDVTMENNIWETETANTVSDIVADVSAVNLKLAGLVQIDSLLMKKLPKNLAIGDSFQTSSKIPISIDDSSPTSLFTVLSYDKIGIDNTETISLSLDQIACFTSIEDSNGVQYTLNVDGTITAK